MKIFLMRWAAFALIILHSTFLFAQVSPNIIGGSNANISQVPWQVLINLNGTDECGGVIIAPNWILTCGHCVYNLQTNSIDPLNEFTI